MVVGHDKNGDPIHVGDSVRWTGGSGTLIGDVLSLNTIQWRDRDHIAFSHFNDPYWRRNTLVIKKEPSHYSGDIGW